MNSFPKKDTQEIRTIEKKFYSHLCDIILESFKMFSIKKAELEKRLVLTNPELPNSFFKKGKSIVVVGGHYNNWEIYGTGISLYHEHNMMALYKKLSNSFFNLKVENSRSQFGLVMRPTSEYKTIFDTFPEKDSGIIFGNDQAPKKGTGVWTIFLNQETAVPYGTEKLATQKNLPVLYGSIQKLKRGFYEVTYEIISEDPSKLEYGDISVLSTKRLEKDILNAPQYWLWSHKRWKRTRTENDKLYQ